MPRKAVGPAESKNGSCVTLVAKLYPFPYKRIMSRLTRYLAYGVGFAVVALVAGCNFNSGTSGSGDSNPPTPQAPAGALELHFTYGSEKKGWIEEATNAFNLEAHQLKSGQRIFVIATPKGSGETIADVLSGADKADLISPASAAFISLGNAKSRTATGKDLVGDTQNLVLSPVVIAMWKPMAEAIGWGKKPIGWSDILTLAKSSDGWSGMGHPEWGKFKFGHTHPEASNSGLISLMAEVYAAAGKQRGLTLDDVAKPEVAEYLGSIEKSVVHYGSSTGFFGDKMTKNGPGYLSAAVLYESVVINSYKANTVLPLVAIYPKEGTFWSDHPVGVVNRDWVTADRAEAAKVYIDYLMSKDIQQKALTYGFRPGLSDVAVGAPIDAAHGADPLEPKTVLEVPSAEVLNATLNLWKVQKKNSSLTLVFDTSGSMQDDHKIESARDGAKAFVGLLEDSDEISLIPFSSEMHPAGKDLVLKDRRQDVLNTISGLYPSGGTALYDAIAAAYDQALADKKEHPDKISAIVVLTDGEDTDSKMTLDQLLDKVKFDNETHDIRIFTIAYGADADGTVLKKISDATQAQSYKGTPENVNTIFRDISTFF